MWKFHGKRALAALFCSFLLFFGLSFGVSAGELQNTITYLTLPDSDTPLPLQLYGTDTGLTSAYPAYVVIPQGTEEVTLKMTEDDARTPVRLRVRDFNSTVLADARSSNNDTFVLTFPTQATYLEPYSITYNYKTAAGASTSEVYYIYFVEENSSNPRIIWADGTNQLNLLDGEEFTLNADGLGDPAQPVEWYYSYYYTTEDGGQYVRSEWQKIEGADGATYTATASPDDLILGDPNPDNYVLSFYALVGGKSSNSVSLLIKDTSTEGVRTLSASNWGSYVGAKYWLNVAATFGGAETAETPVKFYLTDTENGAADTAIEGALVSTTVGDTPPTVVPTESATNLGLGFWVPDTLTAGTYWLAAQVGDDGFRYKEFTVYPDVKAFAQVGLDRVIDYYRTKGFWSADGSTYNGLSVWGDTGTDWKAWMLPNYGHEITDSLMAAADGKTYLDGLERRLSNMEADGFDHSAKDYFRYICALAAVGEDPRDFNGRNLVKNMLKQAYKEDGSLNVDENGGLDLVPDILATSYFLLAAEITNATPAEGYTAEVKEAGIKAILPTVEKSANATDPKDIASSDWLAMQSYPLYFWQDDPVYGERITDALGKLAGMVSSHLYANGGLTMSWPGASSEGSYDDPLGPDAFGYNTNSMAVMLNAFVLFGTTAEDLGTAAWQEDYGTYMTTLLGLIMDDGSFGFKGNSNDMATYQAMGALIDLVTGKSCFINARETYLENYPQYADGDDGIFIYNGSGERISEQEAKITFTSSGEGSFYYAAVDSGAGAPEISTDGEGQAVVAGANTITISDLADGKAKDVYFLVSDGEATSSTLKVSLAATEEPGPTTPKVGDMTDVSKDDWFYEDVAFTMERSIFRGTTPTTFEPAKNITRAEFITILGRYAGNEDTTADTTVKTQFSDVNGKSYYAAHVAWAVENDIVNGVSPTSFAPDENISRQDMATMIYRYAQAAKITLPDAALAALFPDDAQIADYAKTAVYGLRASDIIRGFDDNTFRPAALTLRSEAAAMMHRLVTLAEAGQ